MADDWHGHRDLNLAVLFLGDSPDAVRMHYLFEDATRFDILRVWLPTHDFLKLEPWARKGGRFADVKHEDLVTGAELLLGCEGLNLSVPKTAFWRFPPISPAVRFPHNVSRRVCAIHGPNP